MISVDRNSLSRQKTRWIGFRWTHHIIFYFSFPPKKTLLLPWPHCTPCYIFYLNLYRKKIESLANLCISFTCISRFEVRGSVVVAVVVRCQNGKNITRRCQSIKSISFYSLWELRKTVTKNNNVAWEECATAYTQFLGAHGVFLYFFFVHRRLISVFKVISQLKRHSIENNLSRKFLLYRRPGFLNQWTVASAGHWVGKIAHNNNKTNWSIQLDNWMAYVTIKYSFSTINWILIDD